MPTNYPDYWYDPGVNRYRNKDTGRFISKATVQNSVDGDGWITDALHQKIGELTGRFTDGSMQLGSWESAVADSIKDQYTNAYLIARGGRNHMTEWDYRIIEGELEFQYDRLNNFAIQMKLASERGEPYTEGYIKNRADMYADGARKMYYTAELLSQEQAGYTEGKRILDSQAKHCDDCIAYERMGWVPIAMLVPPGEQCQCHQRCRCSVEYRGKPEATKTRRKKK